MEELIPAIFFILWILFGGVFGRKKREEVRRRAEAERARQAGARGSRTGARTPRETEAWRTTAEPESSAPADDSSADMIPDELWDILTGGAPRPTRPAPAPVPVPEREPVGEGGWVTSPPWDEEDAIHSIEGVSAEEIGGEIVDYDDEADRIARARYEDLRAYSWDDQPTSRDAVAVRQSETSDQRHYEFHDRLRASEIGVAGARRGRTARQRLGLLTLGDARRAIVLAEVIGPPKALR